MLPVIGAGNSLLTDLYVLVRVDDLLSSDFGSRTYIAPWNLRDNVLKIKANRWKVAPTGTVD